MKRTLISTVLLLLGTGLFAQNSLNSKSIISFRNAKFLMKIKNMEKQ